MALDIGIVPDGHWVLRPGKGVRVAVTSHDAETRAAVVSLDDLTATDAAVVGAKAANLARARRAGLRALPGFVVRVVTATDPAAGDAELRHAWRAITDDGRDPVVVRSSSTSEDGASQSMAGLFRTVLDVRGWVAFCVAVETVATSGPDPRAIQRRLVLHARPFCARSRGALRASGEI